MSVLAREIDAYQRALDQYNRQARQYNQQVEGYERTLVRDDQGRALVTRGPAGRLFALLPDGTLDRNARLPGHPEWSPGLRGATGQSIKKFSDYGYSEIEGGNGFTLVRQNPAEETRETREEVYGFYDSETGEMVYYVMGPDYGGDAGPQREILSRAWRIDGKTEPVHPDDPPRYTASRDTSVYPDEPTKPDIRMPAAPDPTLAQANRMARPNLAQVEAGLIGQVMRGRGVR